MPLCGSNRDGTHASGFIDKGLRYRNLAYAPNKKAPRRAPRGKGPIKHEVDARRCAPVVKKHGEISLRGWGIRLRATNVGHEASPLFLASDDGMQLLQQPDKIILLHIYDQRLLYGSDKATVSGAQELPVRVQ
jgi:hypothetical protein